MGTKVSSESQASILNDYLVYILFIYQSTNKTSFNNIILFDKSKR